MKAFLFPGFDSLENLMQRSLSVRLPVVRSHLKRANLVLQKLTQEKIDLKEFILSSDSDFNHNLPLKIAASVTVQTALFEMIRDELSDDDLIVGCSLGDLARTVCAGIASFDETLIGGYKFGTLLMKSQLGCLYRCTATEEISIENLQKKLPPDLYLSVYQTPKHFLIASSGPQAEAWLKAQSFRYSVLAEIPLHSPLMASILPMMETTIRASEIRAPKRRVFSSLWHQEMECPVDCAREAGANIVECVDWVKTLESLANDLKVEEIVSVGPAPTLLRFAERAPVGRSFKMRDAYAQLTSEIA